MLKPKRPAILRRPVPRYQSPDRSGILKWAGAFALVAIILAGVIGHYSQGLKQSATPQPVAPAVQPTPALEKPASQPLAKPQPILGPPGPPPPAVSAPRARLVLYKRWAGNGVWEVMDSTGRTIKILVDPAPRAQLGLSPQPRTDLVPLSAEHIDESHVITMPYGMVVRATLRGFLGSETQLPRAGHIGDMYVVGDVPWIWIQVPGTSAPTWVDP
jgi:hypothetical protein